MTPTLYAAGMEQQFSGRRLNGIDTLIDIHGLMYEGKSTNIQSIMDFAGVSSHNHKN